MKAVLMFIASIIIVPSLAAQELFPYSEPGSIMPSKALSMKLTSVFMRGVHSDKILQRHMPEAMFGVNKI